jgi:hypothetical protein
MKESEPLEVMNNEQWPKCQESDSNVKFAIRERGSLMAGM